MKMKFTQLLLLATVLLLSVTSCSNDDSPSKGGSSKRTVTTQMINHVVNNATGEVLAPAATQNKLTIDTSAHVASLELNYSIGSTSMTATADNLTAAYSRLGFYKLALNGSNSQVTALDGYVDFNEGSMKYAYTTSNGYRVISTLPEVFYLSTSTAMTYSDTTLCDTVTDAIYQFTIYPATMTATVQVMMLLHTSDLKYFENITGKNVPVTVTANGYVISGTNIATTAVYRGYDSSTGSETKTTTVYPFGSFTATLNLETDKFTADYTLNHTSTDSDNNVIILNTATAKATGQVYSR